MIPVDKDPNSSDPESPEPLPSTAYASWTWQSAVHAQLQKQEGVDAEAIFNSQVSSRAACFHLPGPERPPNPHVCERPPNPHVCADSPSAGGDCLETNISDIQGSSSTSDRFWRLVRALLHTDKMSLSGHMHPHVPLTLSVQDQRPAHLA